ncbi:helix-turn-helix domain-containing protein [Halobacillus salinus]|uniref:ArsR family transcriptional regulator n=1 Tax=Halobacillus salinus TaxID=192814 RepID=A0A4Z0GVD4_9BACI|nr:helix-turn-helix domain-containing protein [Halobacillus salinus]TGB01203.1 ArsR family transcriptional regulator [Halobacillus salinus]
MKNKADMILHPVRMKIIQCLARGPATVQDLKDWVTDVPQATLYRHLQALTENNIINVIEERQVRGAVEKTYSLEKNGAHFSADEAKEMTKDDHMELFMMFFANLMRDMENYIDGETRMGEDFFGYNQLDLYVSEEEAHQLGKEINQVLMPYVGNKPTEGRQKISMATAFIPEQKKRGEHNEE